MERRWGQGYQDKGPSDRRPRLAGDRSAGAGMHCRMGECVCVCVCVCAEVSFQRAVWPTSGNGVCNRKTKKQSVRLAIRTVASSDQETHEEGCQQRPPQSI